MMILVALLIGLLFGVAFYLMLRRSIVDLIFGLIVLSHAANLLVFISGGLTRGSPPLLSHASHEAESRDEAQPVSFDVDGESAGTVAFADPVPQALVLTAIVISFGVVAFAMVLVTRLFKAVGTENSDAMRSS